MPFGLNELYAPGDESVLDGPTQDNGVDVVAVHGLAEKSAEAWTHQETGTIWIKDLLPRKIPNARVLTWDYDSHPDSFTGLDFLDKVQSLATTLVADLVGERSLSNTTERPMIFICHGFGGIIVKCALIHSAHRTSQFTSHLQAVYISTFAILFFGTPHDQIDLAKWAFNSPSPPFLSSETREASNRELATKHTLEVVTNHFTQLMKKYHIYFFWEGVKTDLEGGPDFMVKPQSAAPLMYDTERCGVPGSNHTDMIKLHQSHPAYRTVIAALMKYCRAAPEMVAYRWGVSKSALQRVRETEASELIGLEFSFPDKEPIKIEKTGNMDVDPNNRYYYPPCAVTTSFIGQEEILESLQKAFGSHQNRISMKGQKRFVLYGIGGSGKTQLSAKFAQENRDSYWAIFTINASGSATAEEGFCRIARIGGLEPTQESGKHFLSASQKPWLLIIDNADGRNLDFERLVPPGDSGHIIVTTRNPNLRQQGNAGSEETRGLKQPDALKLLLTIAGFHQPWDFFTENLAQEITQALGYLALAVSQAGKAIYNQYCRLNNYLQCFRRFQKARRKENYENATNKAEVSIFAVFDISFQSIADRNQVLGQDAVEILNIVSFYHFDHIRFEIFADSLVLAQKLSTQRKQDSPYQRILNGLLRRITPPEALPRFLKAETSNIDPLYIREVLCELHAVSLITYSEDGQSFSLHPLVHAWARDRIPSREQEIWATIAFNTLMASIPLSADAQDNLGHDPIFRRSLIPHLNASLAACPSNFREFSALKPGELRRWKLLLQPTSFLHLREMIKNAVKCGVVFSQIGDFSKSASYLSLGMEALEQLAGAADEKTTKIMLGLSNVYWGLGRLQEAIELQQRVIAVRQKSLGPEHRYTLQAADSLGNSFWLNGQYVEALELQQSNAAKMKVRLGEHDKDTLDALDHLGVTLSAWCRCEESRSIHQKVLEARLCNSEELDPKVLETKKNLAMALLDLNQIQKAKYLMEEVYEGLRLQMGHEHPYTLWALCYLSKINIEENQLDKAEEILTEGIAAAKRSLGDNHLGVLVGCGELSRVYARQGRLEEAVELSLQTVAKVKEHRGVEHPDYAHGMQKIGELWELCRKPAKAVEAYEIALVATEKRLTTKHPRHKFISNRLAELKEGRLASRTNC